MEYITKITSNICIVLLVVILFFSNFSHAEENQFLSGSKPLRAQVHEVYLLNVDDSADIYTQIIYTNENNESLPFIEDFSFSLPIRNYSKDNVSNLTLFFLPGGPYFELVPYSTINSNNQYTYLENTTHFSEQTYSHNLIANIDLNVNTIERNIVIIENIRYKYTNFSISNGQEKMILVSINAIPMKYLKNVNCTSYDLRVDIPNSPYAYSNFIGSNVKPSKIASRGNGQSIYWDSKPGTDIIITYTITENTISKKLDTMISETNRYANQTKEYNDIVTIFAVISILIPILMIALPWLKENNSNNARKKRRN